MAIELPSEVVGTAIGVLVYSFLALILNGLVIWLTWSHQERVSYIALISYILFLSTATCIASQLHFYVDFQDVMTAQWRAAEANPKNPEMIISNGAVGVDLGLWYFRQHAFSSAAMLVCFWAFALLQSVYGWSAKPHLRTLLDRINAVGKIVSFTLPILTICLLQVKAIQKSLGAFMFLANFVLMISLAFGAILMLGILARYVQSRRQLVTWSVKYGNSSSNNSSLPNRASSYQQKSSGIYDRWLMTRFTVAFIVLSIFELTNMLFQFTGMSNSNKDAVSASPDYSVERAKETTVLFLPGPAPSYLLFIVFGTTTPFRKYITAQEDIYIIAKAVVDINRSVPKHGSPKPVEHSAAYSHTIGRFREGPECAAAEQYLRRQVADAAVDEANVSSDACQENDRLIDS
ncbi:glycoside hydrolase [Seiridium cupressi]